MLTRRERLQAVLFCPLRNDTTLLVMPITIRVRDDIMTDIAHPIGLMWVPVGMLRNGRACDTSQRRLITGNVSGLQYREFAASHFLTESPAIRARIPVPIMKLNP